MNRILRRAAFALVAFALATAARAQISEAQAEQLMKLSGSWAQIDTLGPAMKSALAEGLNKPGNELDDATRQRILTSADAAFDVERLRGIARRALAENVQVGHLPELLAWYRSEAGQRITQAEVTATAADVKLTTEQRMLAGGAVLRAATPERRAQLVRMVELTRAGQTGADFIGNLALAVQTSLPRLNPKAPPADEAKTRAEIEATRPQLIRAFELMALAGNALTYRELPDELLAAYLKFMAGAAGEHYNDQSNRAFEAALLAGFGNLGR